MANVPADRVFVPAGALTPSALISQVRGFFPLAWLYWLISINLKILFANEIVQSTEQIALAHRQSHAKNENNAAHAHGSYFPAPYFLLSQNTARKSHIQATLRIIKNHIICSLNNAQAA